MTIGAANDGADSGADVVLTCMAPVRPETVAALPDPSRVARKHLAALATAVAVAAVIVGASVITPFALAGGHGAPARPAGPAATSPAASASPSSAIVTIVPDVVGMTGNQATAVLQAAGLRVMIVGQDGSAASPGTVITQDPAVGTRLISGATITLTVAAGSGSSSPVPGSTR